LLQGRHKLNLQNLYRIETDSPTAEEILASNDNLLSVLLAAQVRGDDESSRKWISEQQIRVMLIAKPVSPCERCLSFCINGLLTTEIGSNSLLHLQTKTTRDRSEARSSRMLEMDIGTNSPTMLRPVSPGLTFQRDAPSSESYIPPAPSPSLRSVNGHDIRGVRGDMSLVMAQYLRSETFWDQLLVNVAVNDSIFPQNEARGASPFVAWGRQFLAN